MNITKMKDIHWYITTKSCADTINRLHSREPVRDGAQDRAEAPAGGLCAHASWPLISLAQANQQRGSLYKMCGTTGIAIFKKCTVQRGSLYKILEKTSQKEPYPGHPRKSWNPNEKCAVQLKSYWKMCGTTGNILKYVRYSWNPIEKMCGTTEILLNNEKCAVQLKS